MLNDSMRPNNMLNDGVGVLTLYVLTLADLLKVHVPCCVLTLLSDMWLTLYSTCTVLSNFGISCIVRSPCYKLN